MSKRIPPRIIVKHSPPNTLFWNGFIFFCILPGCGQLAVCVCRFIVVKQCPPTTLVLKRCLCFGVFPDLCCQLAVCVWVCLFSWKEFCRILSSQGGCGLGKFQDTVQ